MRFLALILLLFLGTAPAFSKNVRLTIKWTFTNVNEGYDHENKMLVYIDGKSIGESRVYRQTDHATYNVEVTSGKHDVRIQNYAMYEGKWDIHTKENNYSVDAMYEGTLMLTGNTTIDLVFDIRTETASSTITGGKMKAPANSVPLTVTWKYTNVVEGYDHDSRTVVYVDGKIAATSDVIKESKLGKLVVYVPKGNHDILIENYAFYEGNWELHSRENSYSLDAVYSANMLFSKKRSLNLIFDIDAETVTANTK